ncbi:hypothetical protein [Lactobacillus sp. Sy-1]|uniref:hypothetical protein n=1 Tax=Lactobacillus sp. Sy-1 TaxID=2109645 RepID=UPI001C5B5DCD|nr:hypothetical protein [Lactobacillus sp. Sy-1]MBW1606457.1 hypothetical protein [Lactobacillus sp. Sy-1]
MQINDLIDFTGEILSSLIGFGGSALIFSKQLKSGRKELTRQLAEEKRNSIRSAVYIEKYRALNELMADLIYVTSFNASFINYIDNIQISKHDPAITVHNANPSIYKTNDELRNTYSDLQKESEKLFITIEKDSKIIKCYDFMDYEIPEYKWFYKTDLFHCFQLISATFSNFKGSYFSYIDKKLENYSYERKIAQNVFFSFSMIIDEIEKLNENIEQLLIGIHDLKEKIKDE